MGNLIKDKQDLTYLEWSKIRHSSGTAGSYLKATSLISNEKLYYKLSNYDSLNGIIGHECLNELIVDRLLDILEIDHLHYNVIHADVLISNKKYETYLCSSLDFKQKCEEKAAFDLFYELEKEENETVLEFIKRYKFEKQIYEMFVIDFIILNRDRHGANIEVLKNAKNKSIRLSPLFDHGLSLLALCTTKKDILNFNVLDDKPVQCYFGFNSTYKNLELIPKNKLPKIKKFNEKYKTVLFEGLEDVLDEELVEKIWEMISKRWRYYENFCNKK